MPSTKSCYRKHCITYAADNGEEPYVWPRHVLVRLPTATSAEAQEALLPWN
ncbi:transposase domain-containing protein [Cronobacter sakazakii]|uniref:transposase domain-containing protein n=1 Tax=Cronobacter sakazakii TaxID=28141 RepID=UPI0037099B59